MCSSDLLDTRRITLDSGRDLRVYFHPRGGWQGRGKNRRRAGTVTIMRAGSLEPGWYHELAQQAEAADGLTANRPHDWLECKLTRDCALTITDITGRSKTTKELPSSTPTGGMSCTGTLTTEQPMAPCSATAATVTRRR